MAAMQQQRMSTPRRTHSMLQRAGGVSVNGSGGGSGAGGAMASFLGGRSGSKEQAQQQLPPQLPLQAVLPAAPTTAVAAAAAAAGWRSGVGGQATPRVGQGTPRLAAVGSSAPPPAAADLFASASSASGSGGVEGFAFEESSTEPPADEVAAGSGLTAASLKHLRRQRDKLAEEKARILADLAGANEKIGQQRERILAYEEELREARSQQESLREEARQAQAAEHVQRQRAIEGEVANAKLEASLAEAMAEIERLREALAAQRRLAEAAELERAQSQAASDAEALAAAATARAERLERENKELRDQLRSCERERDELRRAAVAAAASAEQALALQAGHGKALEKLKAAQLAEAINHKVELHISVPRVTLNYNNAPPLLISAASALNDVKIREFLSREVFPSFEPMWVRMDAVDCAPDGSTKRAYSTKMLDRLTEAVKAFVKKSQLADEMAPKPGDAVRLNPATSAAPQKSSPLASAAAAFPPRQGLSEPAKA